ncbi:MAG: peptidoglycan DD-metalloendopeptidase family protein [Gammaproteobacteria bacterium]|nr:peptidoglycan DD-metalloendopeptidase family protein [Gammaproteobacteria bacterium]MDE2262654.1 peptidoglycan DD-metalloendopeptidase family protein [Gammaproteobacteria bacterium]
MRRLRIPGLIAPLLLLALAAAPVSAARHAAHGGSHTDAHQARVQLEALRDQIARITRQVSRGQAERDRLTRQLRDTEKSVGKAQAALEDLRRQRQTGASRRAQLEAQKHQLETDLASNRGALAGQLRAAYLIGRAEPLKLLLNQKDPGQTGRMFAYYSYFGRARAAQIQAIEADLQRVGLLDGQLQAQDAKLASLQAAQQAQVTALQQARSHRMQVLASISAQTQTRAERLARLRRQRGDLESLLAQLRRATASLPPEDLGHSPFAQMRGKLPRPVAGSIIERYGEVRAGGLRWQGDLFAAQRDAPVRAVSQGRVVYADWLAGLGLLIIIDHGGGYMSLYGHNARLYESVGQHVTAGQTIAQAGDSGGSARPELYFEIRRQGKPLDPRQWLRH